MIWYCTLYLVAVIPIAAPNWKLYRDFESIIGVWDLFILWGTHILCPFCLNARIPASPENKGGGGGACALFSCLRARNCIIILSQYIRVGVHEILQVTLDKIKVNTKQNYKQTNKQTQKWMKNEWNWTCGAAMCPFLAIRSYTVLGYECSLLECEDLQTVQFMYWCLFQKPINANFTIGVRGKSMD